VALVEVVQVQEEPVAVLLEVELPTKAIVVVMATTMVAQLVTLAVVEVQVVSVVVQLQAQLEMVEMAELV
jgi:hypothetical protein